MMDWDIFKAKSSGSSKASEIVAKLREGIASGALPAGTQLAGATTLGRAYGCSGSPVEGARKKLVKEGLLVIRDGHYFVAGEATPPVVSESVTPTSGSQRVDDAFEDLLKE